MGLFNYLKKKKPGEALVLTDFIGQVREVFIGPVDSLDHLLIDFYKYFKDTPEARHLLEGNLSLYKIPDVEKFKNKETKNLHSLLSRHNPLWTCFAPEVFFSYDFWEKDTVNISLKSSIVPLIPIDKLIQSGVKKYFADYRNEIERYYKSGKDIKRDETYLVEVLKNCKGALVFFYDEEITPHICEQAVKINSAYIEKVPFKNRTKEMLLSLDINPIPLDLEIDFRQFSDQEIIQFIKKPTLRHFDNQICIDECSSLSDSIYSIPKERMTESLLKLLHNLYDKDFGLELSYSLIISGKEISTENAIKAMKHFSYNRFITEWDPVGGDNEYGQVCGGFYALNPEMINPSTCFNKETLTLEQWHDVVASDTRLIDYIPEEIVKNEAFWNNYSDFIKNPYNEKLVDESDKCNVFDRMPEKLKSDLQISIDLYSRGVVDIDFVKNPGEEFYLKLPVEKYGDIPFNIRERETFKSMADKVVKKCPWLVSSIPETFMTYEMISNVLSYNIELCNGLPVHLLDENLLVEKLADSLNQVYLKNIISSSENPRYKYSEIQQHLTSLRYIPDLLKSDRVCDAAMLANPDNAQFAPKEYHLRKLHKIMSETLEIPISPKDILCLYNGSQVKFPISKSSEENDKFLLFSYDKERGVLKQFGQNIKIQNQYSNIKNHSIKM